MSGRTDQIKTMVMRLAGVKGTTLDMVIIDDLENGQAESPEQRKKLKNFVTDAKETCARKN